MIGVYGAAGFIGRHLVRRLVSQSYDVRAVCRQIHPDFSSEFGKTAELVEADILKPSSITPSIHGVDTVVQLISASSPDLGTQQTPEDIQENVVPHAEFIRSCMAAGIRRYIFISSGGTVYGPNAPIPTPETYSGSPICSYGLTKLFVEKCIEMHGHVEGLEYIILRLSNPFGPGQRFRKGQGLIPALIGQYQKKQPVRIFGDGSAERDYIYVDDAVNAIEAAIKLEGSPREIINIGNGRTHSVLEILDAVESVTGYQFERVSAPARDSDVHRSCLDIRKARSMLNWEPSVRFREAIENTLKTY